MNSWSCASRLIGELLMVWSISMLLLTRTWAATVVSGNVSGTWTANASPYILSADCTVASNQTLTIQPGVEVIIGPNVSIQVYGGLTALGTPGQSITIRGAGPTNYWSRILMLYSGFTNRFHYCRISEGWETLTFSVAGSNRVMTTEILNCDFFNCRNWAILGYVQANPPGPDAGDATLAPEIHNCIFDAIGGYGCVFGGFFSDPAKAYLNAHLTGNLFKNLRGQALRLYKGSSAGTTNVSRPVFVNNTVAGCWQGVEADGPYFDPIIRNNVFARTTNAVINNNIGGPSMLDARYNCFFSNKENFAGYPGIYGIPVINNHNGDPCDAFFNIFLDPSFLDTNRFLLRNSSPCIDAGDPAIADVCFEFSHGSAISDIGAYGGPEACGWLTHGFAPVITSAPRDQTSYVGGSASLNVHAEGSEPFSYQWFFNATNWINGQTNTQLNLANLQTNQVGFYSVTVSNAFGSVSSPPARLLVFDACVGIHLYAGLSITGLVGRTYAIDWATNLAATQWLPLATNTLTEPRWLFVDTNTAVNPWRYFRVRLQP